ncbi:exodeoxyribonuclease VII small subunit [Alphaproteobacteria bacterium]
MNKDKSRPDQGHSETDASTNNIEQMPFEVAMAELEKIVALLETGSVALDTAIQYYLKGTKLHEYCSKKLHEAQLKVQTILHKDGNPYDAEKSELEEIYAKK